MMAAFDEDYYKKRPCPSLHPFLEPTQSQKAWEKKFPGMPYFPFDSQKVWGEREDVRRIHRKNGCEVCIKEEEILSDSNEGEI
jgi:hypothetical protein